MAFAPESQVKGIYNGREYIYKADSTGRVFAMYDFLTKKWTSSFQCPDKFVAAISPEESREAIDQWMKQGVFKMRTQYIEIGDEPEGSATVDLRTYIPGQDLKQLQSLLQYMPREYLRKWFMREIWPKLNGPIQKFKDARDQRIANFYEELNGGKKPDEDMVWGALIDLFNQCNIVYTNNQRLDPWAWEEEKVRAYYVAESKSGLAELSEKFDTFKKDVLGQDLVAQSLIEEYNRLPKHPDPGLEITRQYAVSELLKKKEYNAVKGIIDAYKFASETVLADAMNQKIPFDLVVGDTAIKATKE